MKIILPTNEVSRHPGAVQQDREARCREEFPVLVQAPAVRRVSSLRCGPRRVCQYHHDRYACLRIGQKHERQVMAFNWHEAHRLARLERAGIGLAGELDRRTMRLDDAAGVQERTIAKRNREWLPEQYCKLRFVWEMNRAPHWNSSCDHSISTVSPFNSHTARLAAFRSSGFQSFGMVSVEMCGPGIQAAIPRSHAAHVQPRVIETPVHKSQAGVTGREVRFCYYLKRRAGLVQRFQEVDEFPDGRRRMTRERSKRYSQTGVCI